MTVLQLHHSGNNVNHQCRVYGDCMHDFNYHQMVSFQKKDGNTYLYVFVVVFILYSHQLRGGPYDFTYLDVEPLCTCECTANRVCHIFGTLSFLLDYGETMSRVYHISLKSHCGESFFKLGPVRYSKSLSVVSIIINIHIYIYMYVASVISTTAHLCAHTVASGQKKILPFLFPFHS